MSFREEVMDMTEERKAKLAELEGKTDLTPEDTKLREKLRALKEAEEAQPVDQAKVKAAEKALNENQTA